MSKTQFLKDMPYLSYYQSSLRNIVIFTTLSMTFITQAGIYKNKNTLYNAINLIFSIVFLLVAISILLFVFAFSRFSNSVHW